MPKTIKALLLSAGLGTRLRPITESIPKCLVEINNEPILERWLRTLEEINCSSTIVNTHYFAESVVNFVESRKKTNMKIILKYEENLLGTAGTLMENISLFDDKNCTGLVIHADNVTNSDIGKLINFHYSKPENIILTMLTFNTNKPKQCGIVETDNKGIVTGFYEKVDNPPSNKANGAIYVFDKDFVTFIKGLKKLKDFSLDIIPKLIGKIQTFHTDDIFLDIGTPDSYELANKLFDKTN